jgi:ubiquitin-protein ligase
LHRLTKDIKEATTLNSDVTIKITENPAVATINFLNTDFPFLPNRFIVSVPRYYPHNAPAVQCLDTAFYGNNFFDETGRTLHPLLTTQWTAIYSLQTVVLVLREMREMFRTGKLFKINSSEDDSTMTMDEEG